jgi:cytoskeleton protein RodZ
MANPIINADSRIFSGEELRVGTFGERLRREREMRGITLDEIATATKISARNLRALEDEKFNQLPGGVFNRGFVRAYAKFLGIDEDNIVAEYIAASQDTEAAREQKLKAELEKAEFKKEKDEQEIQLEPRSQWGSIAAIVLIAVLAYGGYSIYQKRKAERAQQQQRQSHVEPQGVAPTTQAPPETQQPATTTPSSEPSVTPDAGQTSQPPQGPGSSTVQPATPPSTPKKETSPTTATSNATAASSATPASNTTATSTAPINVSMKAREETWVEVKADGKTLLSAVLPAGTERSFKASERIEVKLGKAAGVELSYNGKTVQNPANIQDVRKLTFTQSGYE